MQQRSIGARQGLCFLHGNRGAAAPNSVFVLPFRHYRLFPIFRQVFFGLHID
jgi:hypothetical protein